MKKVLRIAAGIGLILIGIVGLILPVMPGWVFIIPGLVILGEYYPPIQRLVDWAKAKVEKAAGRRKDENTADKQAGSESETCQSGPGA